MSQDLNSLIDFDLNNFRHLDYLREHLYPSVNKALEIVKWFLNVLTHSAYWPFDQNKWSSDTSGKTQAKENKRPFGAKENRKRKAQRRAWYLNIIFKLNLNRLRLRVIKWWRRVCKGRASRKAQWWRYNPRPGTFRDPERWYGRETAKWKACKNSVWVKFIWLGPHSGRRRYRTFPR